MENYKNIHGTYIDPRDGQKYSTIKDNGLVWINGSYNYKPNNKETGTNLWKLMVNSNRHFYRPFGQYNPNQNLLYNWEAAKNIVPKGWRLPTIEDWINRLNYNGGYNDRITQKTYGDPREAWGKLVHTNFQYMGGYFSEGKSRGVDNLGFYWSSTEDEKNNKNALVFVICDDSSVIGSYFGIMSMPKKNCLSATYTKE